MALRQRRPCSSRLRAFDVALNPGSGWGLGQVICKFTWQPPVPLLQRVMTQLPCDVGAGGLSLWVPTQTRGPASRQIAVTSEVAAVALWKCVTPPVGGHAVPRGRAPRGPGVVDLDRRPGS